MASQEELVKRLEQVTTRLEAICAQKPAIAPKPNNLGGSVSATSLMDPIYYSAPRPYNKYPRGYRPVQESDFAIRRLRPSSSWSSFPQTFDDNRSNTLPHFPSELASPENSFYSYSTQDDFRTKKPQRTESSSTIFDHYNSAPFSPRELSPLSTTSEYCNNPPPSSGNFQYPVAQQEPVRCYDNVPRPYQSPTNTNFNINPPPNTRKENEFLQNLRDQKKEMSSSFYGPDQNYHTYQAPDFSNERQPRRITKTQSDIQIDTKNGFDGYEAPPSLSQSQKLDGFFRNKVIEPNWMTDPPPPKSFRDDYIIHYNSVPLPTSPNPYTIPSSNSNNAERLSYQTESQFQNPTRHITISNNNTIPRDRKTRSYHQDSNDQYFQEPRNDFHKFTMPNREPSPVRSPPFQPHQQVQTFNHYPTEPPPNQRNQQNYGMDKDEYRRENVYQNIPTFSPSYQEHERINPSSRSESFRSPQLNISYPTHVPPSRTRQVHSSAREFARLTSPIRETVLDIHHQNNQQRKQYQPHPAPVHQIHQQQNQQVQQNIDPKPHYYQQQNQPRTPSPTDRIFSPVESKVYNRYQPTVINGFTNSMHHKNIQHQNNNNDIQNQNQNRQRTFQPPIAVIEPNINVPMPSDPIQYYKPQFGHRHHENHHQPEHQLRRRSEATFENSTFVPSNNSTFALSNRKSRTFSPIANYENELDSDLDIEEMARKVLPKYLKESHSNNGRRSNIHGVDLQGILIKNPSLHRSSSKKVVFIDQERASGQPSHDAPPHVRAYDDAVENAIANWSELTDKIGGDIAALKPKVLKVFDHLRNFLWKAAGSAEPNPEEAQKMVLPVFQLINEISEIKSSNNRSPHFNHLSAVAEGLPGVGWVVVKKTPAPYIKDYIEASMFFVNRILKEFKETDPTHVQWTKAWREIFEEMQKFVRQTHTTGLVWNSAPGSAPSESSSAPSAPAPPKAGGPPPPPPPPIPADLFSNLPPVSSSAADKDKSNRDALFASLNKGEAVTSGLKKVTADMQTHKNPNLRASSAVPSHSGGGAPSAARPAAQPVRKPAKKELQDGKQWNVEYFVNDRNIVIDATDKKQTIYIFRCENCVIKVNGKANSITLDGCKKTSIVFDALVAQCETINCQSMQIQTLGELPTLSIQKTDGCQVYLSKLAQGAEIITSKSSEMNISVQTTEDGEYSEFPVPEQFKTTFVNGKLVTTVSDIC